MIFNEKELMKYTENDRDLAADLLQMAAEDIPGFLEKAVKARELDKLDICAGFLHKIKGIAGSIGALEIYRRSALIEGEVKRESTPQVYDENIEELKRTVPAFFIDQEVRNYLK